MSNSSDSDDDLDSTVMTMTTAQRREFNLWINNSRFSQEQDSDSSQEETGLETSSSGGHRGLFDQKSKSSLTKIDERATIPQQWEENESHKVSRTRAWHQPDDGVRDKAEGRKARITPRNLTRECDTVIKGKSVAETPGRASKEQEIRAGEAGNYGNDIDTACRSMRAQRQNSPRTAVPVPVVIKSVPPICQETTRDKISPGKSAEDAPPHAAFTTKETRSQLESWLETCRVERPAVFKQYFREVEIGGSEDSAVLLRSGAHGLAEVRKYAVQCTCGTWLSAGTHTWMKVCSRCYARQKSAEEQQRVMFNTRQSTEDEQFARQLAAADEVSILSEEGGRREEQWKTVPAHRAFRGGSGQEAAELGGYENKYGWSESGGSCDSLSRTPDTGEDEGSRVDWRIAAQAAKEDDRGKMSRAELSTPSPLSRKAEKAKKKRRQKSRGSTQGCRPMVDVGGGELEDAGIRHLLEPLSQEAQEKIWKRKVREVQGMQNELAEICSTPDAETLLQALSMTLQKVQDCEHVSDLYQTFCAEWVGKLDRGVRGSKSIRSLVAEKGYHELRSIVTFWWRYWAVLQERIRLRHVEAVLDEIERRGPPQRDFQVLLEKAGLTMSTKLLSAFVMAPYTPSGFVGPELVEADSLSDSSSVSTSKSRRSRASMREVAKAKKSARHTYREQLDTLSDETSSNSGGEVEGGHRGKNRGKANVQKRELSDFSNSQKIGRYVLNTTGLEEIYQTELEEMASDWFENEFKGQMTQAKREMARTIQPKLHLSCDKVVGKAILPTFNYTEGSILDVTKMYDALDDFISFNHWTTWQVCKGIWQGDIYTGRLKQDMAACITGKMPYLSMTKDRGNMRSHMIVQTALAYYQFKIALIQKVPQIETESMVWMRLHAMTMPAYGSLWSWKSSYNKFRNEYEKLEENHKSGPNMHSMLQQKCNASTDPMLKESQMAWLRCMEEWKGHQGKREESWTIEMMDQAVDGVHTAAEGGLAGGMSHWLVEAPVEKKSDKKSVLPTRTIASAQKDLTPPTLPSEGAQQRKSKEKDPCWCGLLHKGFRNMRGCSFRFGKHIETGEYVRHKEFAGYDPEELTRISKASSIGAVQKLMERQPDGDYAKVCARDKKVFWDRYATRKQMTAEEREDMREQVNVVAASMIVAGGQGIDSREMESEGAESSGESSEDESEDELPLRRLYASTFHTDAFGASDMAEETETMSLLPVRMEQSGHPILGEKGGREVVMFVDGGSDLMGICAEYVRTMEMQVQERPKSEHFRIATSLQGMESVQVCRTDVQVILHFEGREFLGKDKNMETSVGEGRAGCITVRLPVIEGLSHHMVFGADYMAKLRVDDDKASQLLTIKTEEGGEAVSVKTWGLQEAVDWVNKQGGEHGKAVRKLGCWRNLTKMVKQNATRKTVSMNTARAHRLEPGELRFVELVTPTGTQLTNRPGYIRDYHHSMVRVTETPGIPKWLVNGREADSCTVLEQDVCLGTVGVWVRNVSEAVCSLRKGAIQVQVTPIYCEQVMRLAEPETRQETERVYSMARAARLVGYEEGVQQEVPQWIRPELRMLWPLIHPEERIRMAKDDALYSPARLEEIQEELMDKLDINPDTSIVEVPDWEDDGWDRQKAKAASTPIQVVDKGEITKAKGGMSTSESTAGVDSESTARVDIAVDMEGEMIPTEQVESQVKEGERRSRSRRSRCTKGSQGKKVVTFGQRMPPLIVDDDADTEDEAEKEQDDTVVMPPLTVDDDSDTEDEAEKKQDDIVA
jgi:hypothetical protein